MLLSNVSLILLTVLENLSNNDCNNCIEGAQVQVLNKIIADANEERQIETIVYFGEEATIQHYIAPIMSEIPKVVITQTCRLSFGLSEHFSSNTFFLAFGKLKGSSKWQYITKALDTMERQVRGIFVAPYQQRGTFAEHFQWCWLSGFVNVVALVEPPDLSTNKTNAMPFRLFTYTPFPTLNISQVPLASIGEEHFFSHKLSDFRGFKIRTAVQYDPPRVFRVQVGSGPYRRQKIGGYAARTYREFLKYHNGQLEVVPESNLSAGNILSVIGQLKRGDADLSMNVYFNFPGVRTSYALSMTKWCILLPAYGSIPAYAYFLRPFQLSTWLAYVAMLCFLSFTSALNEFIMSKVKRGHARFSFGRAFMESLRLLLYVPSPTAYRCFKLHYAYNYMLLALFGFMLSNYYLALLTSFRATRILKPQINTMQEMVDHNITINAVEYEIPLVLRNSGLPKGFAELLKPRNANQLVAELLRLRDGQAYLVREDTIKFLLVQQKDDLVPKFHAAEECIATMPAGFLMPSHSQFKTVLDIFTMQIAAAGLLQRWFQITILDGFRAGLLTRTKKSAQEAQEALTLLHFQFAFYLILIGSFLGFLSFLLEQLARFRIQTTIQLKKP